MGFWFLLAEVKVNSCLLQSCIQDKQLVKMSIQSNLWSKGN